MRCYLLKIHSYLTLCSKRRWQYSLLFPSLDRSIQENRSCMPLLIVTAYKTNFLGAQYFVFNSLYTFISFVLRFGYCTLSTHVPVSTNFPLSYLYTLTVDFNPAHGHHMQQSSSISQYGSIVNESSFEPWITQVVIVPQKTLIIVLLRTCRT